MGGENIKHVKPLISTKDVELFTKRLTFYDIKYTYMFQIGIYTGLRISDILPLKIKDILPKRRLLKVVESKTGKIRTIPVTKQLRKMVKAVQRAHGLSKDDYIIQGRSKGGS